MGIHGRYFRFFAQSVNDAGVIFLSDKAYRLWVYIKCCDQIYDGCLPDDGELAWYCRFRRDVFDRRLKELITAGFIERGPDGHVALKPRNYENYRLSAEEWAELRAIVFARDDYTCTYCKVRGGRLECDHVHPLSRGGSNELDNLTTACQPCNRSKHAKLLGEWLQ